MQPLGVNIQRKPLVNVINDSLVPELTAFARRINIISLEENIGQTSAELKTVMGVLGMDKKATLTTYSQLLIGWF